MIPSPSPYLTPPPTIPPTRSTSVAPIDLHPRLPFLRPSNAVANHTCLPAQPPTHPACVRLRSSSPDAVNREEVDDGDDETIARADKKRRVDKGGKSVDGNGPGESSKSPTGSALAPASAPGPSSRGAGNLPAIKPVGFAASRQERRDADHIQGLPSPVVMGFDFKAIDEDQMKTVRDTISIKEQQQALIAARRREAAQSQPSTPKELTFKGWAPKDSNDPGVAHSLAPSSAGIGSSSGVGRRREKTRDKVEKMSIVTSATERDFVPGSKSAPLGQGLASQQASPRDPPSGSQTAIPSHILPLPHGYGNGMGDPRTAPLLNARRNGEEHEFARQQGPYFGHPPPRSGGLPRAYDAQPGPRPSTGSRNFSQPLNSLQPPSSSRFEIPSPRPPSGGQHSNPPASPRVSREAFLAPFNQLYDLYAQTDSLRYNLQDLLHRYEGAYQSQINAMSEFKTTANAAGTLLGSLQQSADSLKEMVRYEVERSHSAKDREMDELKERMKRLEEKLDKQGP
ncbi:hypothetical protein IAU60_001559 [Kwoniella sp. DSM 27419]